jgi:ubiquinol-cytochrome c reductase cytochrome c1 subunit
VRELKIVAVVVAFSVLTYYLVEPYAHHEMHKQVDAQGVEIKVESHGFTYDGSDDIAEAERKGDVALAQKKKAFWAEVADISKLKGDAAVGEAGFALCLGCHTDTGTNLGGVVPPSLEHAGRIYDKNYLIALLKDPAMASNVNHKYADTLLHPMGSIASMMSDKQQIADVVAYLLEKKAGEVTPEEAYAEACMRCHALRYANITQLGKTPSFKQEKDALTYKIKVLDEQDAIKAYMGKLPPDLSMIIRARGEHFMETFIENPQSQLAGTSMPRVGLNHEGYEKVKEYLTEAGDPSKKAREDLGPWVIGFFVLFALLAFLWKKHQWRELH